VGGLAANSSFPLLQQSLYLTLPHVLNIADNKKPGTWPGWVGGYVVGAV
jgi:hypothetical protein